MTVRVLPPVFALLLKKLSHKSWTSAMAHLHAAKRGEGAGCWLDWEGNEHGNSTTLKTTTTLGDCEVMVRR